MNLIALKEFCQFVYKFIFDTTETKPVVVEKLKPSVLLLIDSIEIHDYDFTNARFFNTKIEVFENDILKCTQLLNTLVTLLRNNIPINVHSIPVQNVTVGLRNFFLDVSIDATESELLIMFMTASKNFLELYYKSLENGVNKVDSPVILAFRNNLETTLLRLKEIIDHI